MSEKNIKDVLKNLGTDSDFRERMRKEPSTILNGDEYSKLSTEEKTALQTMVDGFATDLKQAKRWRLSISFKELGGAVLSVVLIVLLFLVASKTFGMMNAVPQVVNIGNTTQIIDTYARSRDLLSTLFPLFGAVVTFWLGVAVEGKRADQSKETADRATQDLTNAQEKDKRVRVNLAGKIGEQKGSAKSRLETITQARQVREAAAPDPMEAVLDKMISEFEEIEKALGS